MNPIMLHLILLILSPSLFLCEEVSVCNRTEFYYTKVYHHGYKTEYFAKSYKSCTSWGIFGHTCETKYHIRSRPGLYKYYKYRMDARKEFFCCPGYIGEPPNCKRLCDLLNHPPNGVIKFFNEDGKLLDRKDVKMVLGGYVAYYICNIDHGYTLEGDELRTCQDNGKGWTGTQPTCLEPCPHPFPSQHVGVRIENPVPGILPKYGKDNIAHYWCDRGYHLVGGNRQVCQLQGGVLKWSGSQPSCKANDCGDPGIPSNGTRFGNEFKYASEPLFFKCDKGFALRGSNFRRCEHNGQFSGTQPVCKPILDQCDGHRSIILDQCNRICECDSNNQSVKCVRVRKSWTDLTSEEKQRYIDAVKTITTTDQQYKARYEELARNYTTSKSTFKSSARSATARSYGIILINRYYLLQYENLLREIDCRITIPYWDWTAFHETPYEHPVWDNTLGFGDTSHFFDECVSSGPFNFNEFSVPDELDLLDFYDYNNDFYNYNNEHYNNDFYNYNNEQNNDNFYNEFLDDEGTPQIRSQRYDENAHIKETKVYTINIGDILKQINGNDYAVPEKKRNCLKRVYESDHFPTWQSFTRLLSDQSNYFLQSLHSLSNNVRHQVGGHFGSSNSVYDPIHPLHLSFMDFLYDTWRSLPTNGVQYYFVEPYFGDERLSRIHLNSNNNLPGGVSVSYNVPDIQN